MWEFKHGNGSFRRGDFAGLKEIKRRASRHTLIHRDSFPSATKPLQMPMGPPIEPVPDSLEGRLGLLDHTLYEVQSRLARAEESSAFMTSKCQVLTENLMKSYQVNGLRPGRGMRADFADSITMTFLPYCSASSRTRIVRCTERVGFSFLSLPTRH